MAFHPAPEVGMQFPAPSPAYGDAEVDGFVTDCQPSLPSESPADLVRVLLLAPKLPKGESL